LPLHEHECKHTEHEGQAGDAGPLLKVITNLSCAATPSCPVSILPTRRKLCPACGRSAISRDGMA
jgi:hypothetical protein